MAFDARTPLARMLAGSLLLTLSLAPLAPLVAHPSQMERCAPTSAAFTAGETPAMPCHAGDTSACTHALICAVGSVAVLPAPMGLRLILGPRRVLLPLLPPLHERLGLKPPTPPPNH